MRTIESWKVAFKMMCNHYYALMSDFNALLLTAAHALVLWGWEEVALVATLRRHSNQRWIRADFPRLVWPVDPEPARCAATATTHPAWSHTIFVVALAAGLRRIYFHPPCTAYRWPTRPWLMTTTT
jgi:hypothetical protein